MKQLIINDSTLFFETDFIKMYHAEEFKIMAFVWQKKATSEQYRQSFMRGHEYAKDHTTNYFLSDIVEQGVVGTEDRKWFEEVALPAAIEVGLKKTAVVFDGNIFKQYYINNLILKFTGRTVPLKFFRDYDSAINFLKEL